MSILDLLFTNASSVSDGVKVLSGKQDYLIAFDGEEVVCYFYDSEAGKTLLEKYLTDHNCNVNVDIRKMTLKKDNEFFELYIGRKLVVLDSELTTYDEVVKLAETIEVKGYKPNKLKSGINVFHT